MMLVQCLLSAAHPSAQLLDSMPRPPGENKVFSKTYFATGQIIKGKANTNVLSLQLHPNSDPGLELTHTSPEAELPQTPEADGVLWSQQ